MVYNKSEDIQLLNEFDRWFDDLTQADNYKMYDDIFPNILASGDWAHHGYDGMGLSWHHGYDGMGVF